jgi:hypothetical protein
MAQVVSTQDCEISHVRDSRKWIVVRNVLMCFLPQ